jgi:uncharacterized protein YbjT (DUF2867 family)
MAAQNLHVLGASGLVGRALLRRLARDAVPVTAHSRTPPQGCPQAGVTWRCGGAEPQPGAPVPTDWISLVPIRALPDYFDAIEAERPRRVVVVSSTSRFSKAHSSDAREREIARGIARCEADVEAWATARGIDWVVLRPTLIYGNGDDRNICEIARLITRFGFFPLIGAAHGRRQPVHADDVADACLAALEADSARNRAYDLSGSEVLTYRDMVGRVFAALSRPRRLVVCPVVVFRLALAALRLAPRYRLWSMAMVERMNQDMVFGHDDAKRDLGFEPRPFRLEAADLPR